MAFHVHHPNDMFQMGHPYQDAWSCWETRDPKHPEHDHHLRHRQVGEGHPSYRLRHRSASGAGRSSGHF